MCFFENEFFLNILKHFKHIAFPILVPVIAYLANNHWHELILESLEALRSIIREQDNSLYEKYVNQKDSPYLYLIKTPEKFKESRIEAEDIWKQLEQKAKANNPELEVRPQPYQEGHIVGEYNGLESGDILYVD